MRYGLFFSKRGARPYASASSDDLADIVTVVVFVGVILWLIAVI